MNEDNYIGKRIRSYRLVRGMTQQQLADVLDMSRPAITHYESGTRPIDSREVLYKLAEALQVSIGDLTGHAEDKINPSVAAFHAEAPAIEAALMSAGHVDLSSALRPVDALLAITDRAQDLRSAANYTDLGRILPGLLTELYQHAYTGDEQTRQRAWSGLAQATFCTALAMKALGHTSLAWIAAQATDQAAGHTQEGVDLTAAAYVRAQVMLATPQAVGPSATFASEAVNRLEPLMQTPDAREMYGMLNLHAALATTANGRDGAQYLSEADRLVVNDDEGRVYRMSFGAPNIAIWRMSIAMEQRAADDAVQIGADIIPESIASPDRRSRYWIELGRGQALQGDHAAAMTSLLRAEHIAPQQVRSRVVVRELVGSMLRHARRDLVNGNLGRLAQRVGAVPE